MSFMTLGKCHNCGGGGSTTIGDITVGNTPLGVTYAETRREETSMDKTFVPGAYFVSIKPVKEPITVNGDIVSPGGHYHFEAQTNLAGQFIDLAPQIQVVANGQEYWYHLCYPSNFGVSL
jgi:hypothetical protein